LKIFLGANSRQFYHPYYKIVTAQIAGKFDPKRKLFAGIVLFNPSAYPCFIKISSQVILLHFPRLRASA